MWRKIFKNQMQMEYKYNKTQFLLDGTGEQNRTEHETKIIGTGEEVS